MEVPSKSSMILPTRCSEDGMNLAALCSAVASAHQDRASSTRIVTDQERWACYQSQINIGLHLSP